MEINSKHSGWISFLPFQKYKTVQTFIPYTLRPWVGRVYRVSCIYCYLQQAALNSMIA